MVLLKYLWCNRIELLVKCGEVLKEKNDGYRIFNKELQTIRKKFRLFLGKMSDKKIIPIKIKLILFICWQTIPWQNSRKYMKLYLRFSTFSPY